MIALASCECDHEEDISAISELHVGSVVCADGTVLSEKRFEESDKEAMGIVFHVDSDNEILVMRSISTIWNRWLLPIRLEWTKRHPLPYPKKTATRILIRSSTARTWLHRWQ